MLSLSFETRGASGEFMRVTVIGTGYVGTVTGVCLSYLGHRVTCVDVDAEKIARLQRGELPIPGQTPLTNSPYILGIDPFLQRQSGMERHGPGARVGDRVGEQNGLDLRFGEAAAAHISEQTDEAADIAAERVASVPPDE